MELYLVRIADLDPVFDKALALVLPSRREQVNRFYHREDQLRSLGAGLLLRSVLGVCREEDLCFGPQKKPGLARGHRAFSLSHSGDYAMLAVSDQCVGADLEQVKTFPASVARGQFTDWERAWAGEDPTRLFTLWTGKEAVMKWTGQGLTLSTQAIAMDPQEHTARLSDKTLFWQTGTLPGHVWSVVSQDPEPALPQILGVPALLQTECRA